MAILKKIYIWLLPLLFPGCIEYFTPEEDTKPVLCINSIITAGEPIEVSVTHSWLFTDQDAAVNHQVHDAKVSVYANDILVGADYLPKEGDRIRITAESTAYGSAEAEVEVPVSVPVELVSWEVEIIDKWDLPDFMPAADTKYYMRLNAKMTVKDPARIENFYQFSYSGFTEEYDSVPDSMMDQSGIFFWGYFNFEAEPIFSEHIGILDAVTGNNTYTFTLFTDRQFSGETYTLNLQVEYMNVDISNCCDYGNIPDFGLVLSLYTVSKSYYNWRCYEWNRDYGLMGELGYYGLGDTAWGYSNVSTGAGVVAARSRASYVISLKDFLLGNIGHTP